MTQHYFETPQARGERVYHEDYGLGTIIEMHDGTYGMHNGVMWDSPEIVDKYIGIDGMDPKIFTTELLYFMREAEAQRIRADKAEEEMTSFQEMVDGANYQAQQAIQQLYDEKKVMEKENTERIRERNKAVNEQYQRAEKAEQLINKLDKAVNEDDELDEWDYFAILIRKEITAYREGSNTDEHTSNSIQSQE